jgi:tetratricopeptide (TPR) repeat protein
MPAREALIVASAQYTDPLLRQLQAPAADAAGLIDVLSNQEIGGFQTKALIDRPSYEIAAAIEEFFIDRQPDDLLLLYFSGHGIKDVDGRLYFATTNTKRSLLLATSVPASMVNDAMLRSRSRREVLILDCCHSGAFARGMVAKSDSSVGISDSFQGTGRIVLTASDATQYALEAEQATGTGVRSIFTEVLVNGLKTGEADTDFDGRITLDELFAYTEDKVLQRTPNQKPMKWALGVTGSMIIAQNKNPVIHPAELSPNLLEALDKDNLPSIRQVAVKELGKILARQDRALALAAELKLNELVADDSRTIQELARGILAEKASRVDAEQKRQAAVDAERDAEQSRREQEEQKQKEAAEKARLAEEERQRQAEAEKVRLRLATAELARRQQEEQEKKAATEKARLAEEERLRQESAEKTRREKEAQEKKAAVEAARRAEHERLRQAAAEQALLAQEEQERKAAAEKARLAAVETARRAQEVQEQKAAAERARLAEEERQRQAAAEKARREQEEQKKKAPGEDESQKQKSKTARTRIVGFVLVCVLLVLVRLWVSSRSKTPQPNPEVNQTAVSTEPDANAPPLTNAKAATLPKPTITRTTAGPPESANAPPLPNANPAKLSNPTMTKANVLPTETTNEFLPDIDKFRRQVQQNPKDPDAHDSYGNALREAGQVDAAIEQFQMAVKLPPKDIGRAYLYRDLGEAYEKKGDYDSALAAMRKSVTLWPVKSEPVLCRLPFEQGAIGRILEEKGDFAGAMEYWRSLVSVAKDPDECQRQAERLSAKVPHYANGNPKTKQY